MSVNIDVDGLRLTATADWNLRKWDDSTAYRKGLQKLIEGSKAVDLVGLRRQVVYFIELKDFVGHHIENKQRLTSPDLPIEVASKVRDTVSGLVGEGREVGTEWTEVSRELVGRNHLHVILWVFVDKHELKNEVTMNTLEQELSKRLRWLKKCRVRIATTQDDHALEGITAKRLKK